MSKPIFLFFCIILTWLVYTDAAATIPDNLPCLQQLLPCQPYLKVSTPPPMSCCMPLKQIVQTERQCLCALFNNQQILQSFNVTQADGLALAKSCGETSAVCTSNNAPASPSSSSPSTPVPSAPSIPSANSSATVSPPATSAAAVGQSLMGGSLITIAAIISWLITSVAL